MKPYTKALAALLGAVGTWGVTAAEDERIATGEWFGLLIALGTALSVYALPNRAPDSGREPHMSETEPEAGASVVEVVLVALILVVLLILLGRL